MRNVLAATVIVLAATLPGAGLQSALAESPKGMVLCLAACAKSDKGCQDRCAPSATVSTEAKACVSTCRQRASDPDLVVELTRCVSTCLGDQATQ